MYSEFRQSVRDGLLGETGQFWLQYMDCVWVVLRLNQAVKENNYEDYKIIVNTMPDLFFAADQHNYARFLSYFSHFLRHIEETHPGAENLLRAGAISVARSYIPGNRCHTDKTIEETAMKWLKSNSGSGTYAAGISGITTNYAASQRHILAAHAKGEFVQALWKMVDAVPDCEQKQRNLRPSQIARSEMQVQNTIAAFESFLNPFNLNPLQPLTSLASGAAMTADVREDALNALKKGESQKQVFIHERLESNSTKFFEPVKKNKFKTMAFPAPVKKLTASKSK